MPTHLVTSASASIIPSIFMLDAIPITTLPIYRGLGQALSYPGLHTLWFGSTYTELTLRQMA